MAEHLPGQYNFAVRMCLDEERAQAVVVETFRRAYIAEVLPESEQLSVWLLGLASEVLTKRLDPRLEVSFDLLDETLRSEATRTDVVRSLVEPRRDFLLWELKQGCMNSVVHCLSAGERSAFVLSTIMKLDDASAASVLEVTMAAFKVRLSRAKKKIGGYLAPRCEHIDPMNPCSCPARVGVALSKGFIQSGGEVNLRKPLPAYGRYGAGPGKEDVPLRDIVAIYKNLPEARVPDALIERLREGLDSGRWG